MATTKTAPKTAPKTRRAAAKGSAAKTTAKAAPKAATPTRGPSAETLAKAAKVVKLRDSGLAWSVVAERLGVDYSSGYSSLLRRLYTIGGGATVGVRKAASGAKATPKATTKRTRGTTAKAPRETATARRARLGAESAKASRPARRKAAK